MDSKIMSESLLLLERIPNIWSKDAHHWFPFRLGGWMDSSSDEEVIKLEQPTKKLNLGLSHGDHWHIGNEEALSNFYEMGYGYLQVMEKGQK